jgi:tetrahydromethanopterin S-methyltransferase subunit G
MAKETTIEDLAEMVRKGFSGVDKRFGEVDKRFDKVEARLDTLDARVGRIEADIHELRGEIVYRHEFEDVLGRIKYIERKLGIESGV